MQKLVLKPMSFDACPDTTSLLRPSTSQSWQHESVPDAHLLIIQVCRATLAAGVFMSVLACITTTESDPRIRLQCALIATACAVSSLFYRHLYELRRLPKCNGYSQEGNAVSNALRFTSWAVTIALLAWIAFLLRGPFQDGTYLGLSYGEWLYVGPLLATLNVLLGIPGWEAARVFSGSNGMSCTRIVAVMLAALFLGGGLCISILINRAMHMRPTTARSSSDVNLAQWLSWIWVAYPFLQLLKTVAVFQNNDHVPRLTSLAKRFVPIASTKNALQFAFRTMVAAPTHHAREIANIYTMIEPEHSIDMHTSTPNIRPQWTQVLDTLMAIVDTLSQGVLALVLVTHALPTEK